MTDRRDLCYMYDTVWTDMCKDFRSYYNPDPPKMATEDIIEICKYALEYYGNLQPETVNNLLNMALLKRMKLYPFLKDTGFFPEGLSETSQIHYLIYQMYPEKFAFNPRGEAEFTYKEMIECGASRPIGFFSNTLDGRERAKICFRYMLLHYHIGKFHSLSHIFEYFNTTKGKAELIHYRLGPNIKNFGTMANFIFESLTDCSMTPRQFEECGLLREKYNKLYWQKQEAKKIKEAEKKNRNNVPKTPH